MEIIDKLQEKVFTDGFVDKLKNFESSLSIFLGHTVAGEESIFLNAFADEIRNNLQDHRIFTHVELKTISELPEEATVYSFLGERFDELRKKVCTDPCWTGRRDQAEKCFKGFYRDGTDIDAIITNKETCCLLEYEADFRGHCENLFKMYRLRKLANYEFEYLFVTRANTVRNREEEGKKTTQLLQLNKYIKQSKRYYDNLLGKRWRILAIIDLNSRFPILELLP